MAFKKDAKEAKPKLDTKMEPLMLGLLLYIAAEVMFFAGLISACLVFRLSPFPWPPVGQPRLPVEVTAANTFFLILSGFTFHKAFKALNEGKQKLYSVFLTVTFLLGVLFLVIQGFEWIRMVRFGLSVKQNAFGGFFYILVGMHGFHVFCGVFSLFWVLVRSYMGTYSVKKNLGVKLSLTYWLFVVGLWPVLFGLLYF